MSPRWPGFGTKMRLLMGSRSSRRWLEAERLRRGPDPFRGADNIVSVGPYRIGFTYNDRFDMMAVFRDDAVTVASHDPSALEMTISMPGPQVADRLDLLGVDESAAHGAFDTWISQQIITLAEDDPAEDEEWMASSEKVREVRRWSRQQDHDAIVGLDCQTWIARTRTAAATAEPAEDHKFMIGPEPENFWWLLHLVTGTTGLNDPIMLLRLILLVFPDEQVTIRVRNLSEGWIAGSPANAPSHALRAMQGFGATYSPTVVLTEGRTDAEFLRDGLSILYPHLDDLVRFMDFDAKNEGSASALVRTVRSFVAAGITNRIVAVFDNDAAAEDAMRSLAPAVLPDNVVVMQYPVLDLADCYPTYGPPNSSSPDGVLSTANVNGLAGSIELYLGRDVLTDVDGQLRPVQWRSFIAGVHRYQGEVTGKGDIQRLYRAKVKAARDHGGPLPHQDWTGLLEILQRIIRAHQSPTH
jgi:hypothetical protein